MIRTVDLATLATVRDAARHFRIAIEKHTPAAVGLEAFPRGACGDACELLGECFRDSGLGDWTYRFGWTSVYGHRVSHAWLERDGLIVDITADQFPDVSEPVWITSDDTWHSRFQGGGDGRAAGLDYFGTPYLDDIQADYRSLKKYTDEARARTDHCG